MIKTQWSKTMLEDWGLTYNQHSAILSIMRISANDFRDETTDEISCTLLAEYTANRLDHDEWLDDETHPIWDLAVDVADERQYPSIEPYHARN